MSFRIVRNSKFRHIFGQPLKREQCYDNIRITSNSWDSSFCAVNPKFLAIVIEAAGGGAFLALPLSKTGRIDASYPLVNGHRGPVLDIAWCPFDDNIIASGSEDGVVRVWQIPDGGLVRPLMDPVVELVGHQRRAGMVLWHPCANNVLLSAGADCKIIMWNVGTAEMLFTIIHPDLIWSVSWNWDGTRLVTTCKDKKIRIYDPRTGDMEQGAVPIPEVGSVGSTVVRTDCKKGRISVLLMHGTLNCRAVYLEAMGHEGSKPQKAIFLRNGLLFTTGFSRMSERQYALRSEVALSEPIVLEELDTSNGIMSPIYDPDVNLLYLCAKGDSNIRYFEITDEPPFVHYINTYQSTEPQRGIGSMPKRGCDIYNCEIARFYKLHSRGFCEVITFTVPRKSEHFQDDLYPDTLADTPAVSADEWASGKDGEPVLMSLKEGYKPKKQEFRLSKSKSNILDKMPTKTAQKETVSQDKLDVVMDEIRKLKSIVLKQEVRIRDLEKKVEEQRKNECPDHLLPQENMKEAQVNNVHHEPPSLVIDTV